MRFAIAAVVVLLARTASAEQLPGLTLVEQINIESAPIEDPPGASRVETILGEKTRTMASTGGARYFGYIVGKDKGLKPGAAYVLEVDFPEDAPRSMFVLSRGSETARGISTGSTLGDVLESYVAQNHESLNIPLSGKTRTYRLFFHLHDRFPEILMPRDAGSRPRLPKDGFHVIIAQSSAMNAPLSKGAAVSAIRLYSVADESKLVQPIHYPDGLPRRHIYWREEMSDGVVSGDKLEDRGLDDPLAWYDFKARRMRFLGINTVAKDLLEFGSNQGWDSTAYGGNDWYYMPSFKDRWQKIVELAKKYDYEVLPYFEYGGSKGAKSLGFEKRARPLTRSDAYTHITWSETANADLTDPDTLADTKKLIDATIGVHKDRAKFFGAWFRTRVSNLPISFADKTIALYVKETGTSTDRTILASDATAREKYYAWWFGKRRTILLALRDHLRTYVPDGRIVFTPVSGEPGPTLDGGIVTDDPARFAGQKMQPFDDVIKNDLWLKTSLAMVPTWGGWEWQHSLPPADPARYVDDEGVQLTYPMNRVYSASSSSAFDAYRTKSGLAAVRFYTLNEDSMEGKLGYFVADVDRAGPYSMMTEARSVAFGDPDSIGYLASHDFNRGFPEYTRAFNAAFLALPAIPSKVIQTGDVMVRSIDAGAKGTYLAVINVSLRDASAKVKLPVVGHVRDLVADKEVAVMDGAIAVALYPGELRALRITAEETPVGTPENPGGPTTETPSSNAENEASTGCACSLDRRETKGAWLALALLLLARHRRE